MNLEKKIPVTIISGFLGAGKTTFLNSIISSNKNVRYAIIENEFGEIGIDQDLVIKTEDNIFEMSNGCICCSLNEDLYLTLEKLYKRRNDFEELLIETTGIADPSSVALPFIDENQFGRIFELKRIVCLADAEFIEDRLKESEEAVKQIVTADILIINKIDLVTAEYVEKLKAILSDLNPLAKIFVADKNQKPIAEIFAFERQNEIKEFEEKFPGHNIVSDKQGSRLVNLEKISKSHTGIHKSSHDHEENASGENSAEKHHHAHSDIESYAYITANSIDVDILAMRLLAITSFNSKAFFRIKGILSAKNNDKKLILQSAGGSLVLEEGPEWKETEQRISKIVFIGKKLHKEKFKAFLDTCIVND